MGGGVAAGVHLIQAEVEATVGSAVGGTVGKGGGAAGAHPRGRRAALRQLEAEEAAEVVLAAGDSGQAASLPSALRGPLL